MLPAHIREVIEKGQLRTPTGGAGDLYSNYETEVECRTRIALMVAEDCAAQVAITFPTAARQIRAAYGLKEKRDDQEN